jgi:hypothetical protein
MARHHPRVFKHVVSLRKVYEGVLHLRKKISKLVDRRKQLKETRLGVGFVSNSNFLSGDVGITGLVIQNFGKQIIVSSSSIYLLLYFLVQLCFCVIHCDVLYCLVDIVYIYLSISL